MNEAPASSSSLPSEICSGLDCSKPAGSLACPTCIKLGIKTSKFCDQDCFKRNWATHKAVHVGPKIVNGVETYDPFPQRVYTGSLRACYQKNKLYNPRDPSQRRHVPLSIRRPNYADDINGDPKYPGLRERKPRELNAEEIDGMREACRVSREVLDHAASFIKPGITTDELDRIVHQATIDRGAYPSPLNYRNFPRSFCSSVNEVICHGIPDLRPLEEGDIVNLDVSCYYKGFHGDLNATYPVGKIDADSERLIRTARACLDAAIAIAKPGTLYRDFGAVIEKVATDNNCTVNRTYCGHGINQLFHPAPSVPHYAKNKAPHFLKPGHTFTIEPMICLGSPQETHWPDNWTAVTIDGKRSAQFEETLLVTETGIEILTAARPLKADANGSETAISGLTDQVAEASISGSKSS
ncbi:Methionine aminopeptidase 1 [Cystobasidiomycetes sp. EMM_F5]